MSLRVFYLEVILIVRLTLILYYYIIWALCLRCITGFLQKKKIRLLIGNKYFDEPINTFMKPVCHRAN